MNSILIKLGIAAVVGIVGIVSVSQTLMVEKEMDKCIEKSQGPCPVTQSTDVPVRLQERMDAMVTAMKTGDAKAYAANYNVNYLFKLAKGQVKYDANLFGGSAEDAQRLQQNLSGIASPEALAQAFEQGVNLKNNGDVQLESVEISEDGTHATATLIRIKDDEHKVISSPQWHYFDNDWWQIDD